MGQNDFFFDELVKHRSELLKTFPCANALPVVGWLSSYRNSESCTGKVEDEYADENQHNGPPVLGVLRRNNGPIM